MEQAQNYHQQEQALSAPETLFEVEKREATAELQRANNVGNEIEDSIIRYDAGLPIGERNRKVDEGMSDLVKKANRAHKMQRLPDAEFVDIIKAAVEKTDDLLTDTDPTTSGDAIGAALNEVPADVIKDALTMMSKAKPIEHTKGIMTAMDKNNMRPKRAPDQPKTDSEGPTKSDYELAA